MPGISDKDDQARDAKAHQLRSSGNPLAWTDVVQATISTGRRSFVSGMVAAAAGTALTCFGSGRITSAFAQAPAVNGLIDVHHHFIPPFYLDENRDRIAAGGGGWIILPI